MEDAARIAYRELVRWMAADVGFEKELDAYMLSYPVRRVVLEIWWIRNITLGASILQILSGLIIEHAAPAKLQPSNWSSISSNTRSGSERDAGLVWRRFPGPCTHGLVVNCLPTLPRHPPRVFRYEIDISHYTNGVSA